MKTIKLVLYIGLLHFCLSVRHIQKDHHSQFRSESHFVSQVFTSSNINGKPETHVRKMEMEEYRNKDGDGPEKVRKYGEIVKKDNDNKAELIREASSNDEKEGLVLGHGKEKKVLDKNEEKQFLPNMPQGFGEKGFKPFFDFKEDFVTNLIILGIQEL